MRFQVYAEYADGSESEIKYAFSVDACLEVLRSLLSGPVDVYNIVIEPYTK